MHVEAISETTWIAASAIATFLLAVATAAFVYAAFGQLSLLRQGQADAMRSANAVTKAADVAEIGLTESRKASLEQSIAATFPVLDIAAVQRDTALKVEVANRGTNPALDVDHFVYLEYADGEDDFKEFVGEQVSEFSKNRWLELDVEEDDIWALSDRLFYATVPPRRRVVAEISPPMRCETFHVLAQHRDVIGRNFCQLNWYVRSDESDRFRLAGSPTRGGVRCPRFSWQPAIEEPETDSGEVPARLDRALTLNLRSIKERIVPLGVLKNGSAESEDRGSWGDA
jgi:hypothetical protein